MDEASERSQMRQLLDAVITVGSDLDLHAMLHRIVRAATDLVDARYGALGVLDETGRGLAQFFSVGVDDEVRERIGHVPEGHGILGLLIVDARPLRIDDIASHPDAYGFPPGHPVMHSFLGVPIRVRNEVFGNLYLTDKKSGEPFTEIDEELVVGLASAAAVAIENARLHARLQEVALVEDRERIARELHDLVIQRLFAIGLSLQGGARLVATDPDAAVARIEAAVDDLDLTVKHIRSVIFGLESTRMGAMGLRDAMLSLLRRAAGALGFEPTVLFDGPIDSRLPDDIGADVLATLQEALSNVARHAHATDAEVTVAVDDHDVVLQVIDNGVGYEDTGDSPGHGVKNMRARAEGHGGSLSVAKRPGGGTIVEWRVPLRR